jgi:hypothetical protein
MSVAAYIWRRQFSFLPGWLKPLFWCTLLLFALNPRLAVLSGPASVSPHNSIPSYWNLGAPPAPLVWTQSRRPGHESRRNPSKLYSIFGLLASHPLFTSGCGIRIVRHLAGLHVRRLRYQVACLFAHRTALMHEGVAVPSLHGLSVFPSFPFFHSSLTAPHAPPSSRGSLNPDGDGLPLPRSDVSAALLCQSWFRRRRADWLGRAASWLGFCDAVRSGQPSGECCQTALCSPSWLRRLRGVS